MKAVTQIAMLMQAVQNCKDSGNDEWFNKHSDALESLVEAVMPSGSGFDNGTTLQIQGDPNRLVFRTQFHHMDENGMYDGWTAHKVVVTPDLIDGFSVRVDGPNKNDVKQHISETFYHCLRMGVERSGADTAAWMVNRAV